MAREIFVEEHTDGYTARVTVFTFPVFSLSHEGRRKDLMNEYGVTERRKHAPSLLFGHSLFGALSSRLEALLASSPILPSLRAHFASSSKTGSSRNNQLRSK